MKKTLILLLLTLCYRIYGQEFPVTVTLHQTHSFPVNLNELQNIAGIPFHVQLKLNDFHSQSELIYLGIEIRTTQTSISSVFPLKGTSIQLFPGEFLMADNFIVSELFLTENLQAEGPMASMVLDNGRFPEGVYQLHINAYDALNNRKLSNTPPLIFSIIQEEPPLLVYPDRDLLEERDHQPLTFRWMSRIGSSWSTNQSVMYRFELIQLNQTDLNPVQSFQLQIPLVSVETPENSLIYDSTYPSLIPGEKYAFRVTAFSHDETILFKNDGVSTVQSFQWGKSCLPPNNITVNHASPSALTLSWEVHGNENRYDLEYKTIEDSTKYYETAELSFHKITELQPNTPYAVRVKSNCVNTTSAFTNWKNIRTTAPTPLDFSCGIFTTPPLPDSVKLQNLYPDERFKISDFNVLVIEVSESGIEGFSGKGTALLPYFNKAKIAVDFKNVVLDKNYQATSGNLTLNEIEPVWADKVDEWIDKTENFIEKAEETITVVQDVYDSLSTFIESTQEQPLQTDTTSIAVVQNDTTATYSTLHSEVNVTSTDSTSQNSEFSSVSTNTTPIESTEYTGNVGVTSNTNSDYTSPTLSGSSIQVGGTEFLFSATPESNTYNEKGNKVYSNVRANTSVTLTSEDYSADLHLENIDLSFTQDTTTNEILEVSCQWNGKQTATAINWLALTVEKLDLNIEENGLLSGAIKFNPSIDENYQLTGPDLSEATLSGKVLFTLENTPEPYGQFDFSGMTMSNLSFPFFNNKNVVIREFSFGTQGISDPISMEIQQETTIKDGVELNIERLTTEANLSVVDLWNISSGNIKGTLTGLPHLSVINFDDSFERNLIFEGTLSEKAFYGMETSNTAISMMLNQYFLLSKIEMKTDLRHDLLEGQITMENMTYSEGLWKDINIGGKFTHNGLSIELLESEFLDDNISANGVVEYIYQEQMITSTLKGFQFTPNGDIIPGNYAVTADLQGDFGPYTVIFETTPKASSKEDGFDVFQNVKGTLIFNNAETESKVKIASVVFNYKEDKHGNWKEFQAKLTGKEVSLGQIGPFEANIKGLIISIDNNQSLNIAGHLLCEGKIKEDVRLDDLMGFQEGSTDLTLTLKKGAESDMDLHFEYKNGLLFLNPVVKNLRNIDLKLHKGKKPIAGLVNFSFYEDGKLKGRLQSLVDAEYETPGASVALDEMELDFEVYPFEKVKNFKITKGKIRFKVYDIKGMTGRLVFEAAVDEENIITRVIDNYSDIKFYGFTISDLKLTLKMSPSFDVQEIYGSFAANHEMFGGALEISEFQYEQGKITKFYTSQAKVKYKGFEFEISDGNMQEDNLQFNARLLLRLADEEAAKLSVSEFQIDSLGTIYIGSIEGKVAKSPVLIDFSAQFSEKRFTGNFNGDFGSFFQVNGQLDIGAEDSYHFGYMALNSTSNIPLGPAFKISKLGGNFGFNYDLSYDANTGKFKGSPKKGQYAAGLGLGIADITGRAELYGNPVIQFGAGDVKLNLHGTLAIPRNTPNYYGELYAEYNFTREILKGSLHSTIRIPADNGKIVNAAGMRMEYFSDTKGFSLSSSNVQATFLETIRFTGNLDLIKTEEKQIKGSASGSFMMEQNHHVSADIYVGTIEAGLNLSLTAFANIELQDNDISGQFNSMVSGSAYLQFTNSLLGTTKLATSYSGSLEFVRQNQTSTIDGTVILQFEALGNTLSHEENINITL